MEMHACTLSPEELVERVAQWRTLAREAIDRTASDDVIVGTYPRRDDVLELLNALIAAEARCCPFLEFDVRERGELVEVELRFPPEFRPMLEAVLGGHRKGHGD